MRWLISLSISLAILSTPPVFATPESTPWGSYDFPAPVRDPRDARAMYAEARLPIVIAVRFLASTDSTDTPWIHPSLACGTGELRQDLTAAMVRASTLGAAELLARLDEQIKAAAALRNGAPASMVTRYAGPVHVVLEPMRITVEGEAVPQLPVVEPHLRVFVSASVPRCAADASGAFGLLGEITSSFMITASPALELGWPTYSTTALGQRIVMATDNMLTDGFCCGQEAAFGLDSLISVFDYRDYRHKERLRNTIHRVATSRQRDTRWLMEVRDAFGVPDRYPNVHVQELKYGTGRLTPNEFTVWPARTEMFVVNPGSRQRLRAPADFLMALAWYAHTRADLISPAILESYDPQRRYSFVGWPEEFRELEVSAETEVAFNSPRNRVLEVFGAERRFSFVGRADTLNENIEFAFAAWKLQTAYSQSQVTDRFKAVFAPTAEFGRLMQTLMRMEADARRQRRPSPLHTTGSSEPATYTAALASLAQPLPFLDSTARSPVPVEQNARQVHSLQWSHHQMVLDAATVTDLYLALVDLYKTRFESQLAGTRGTE